MDCVKCGAPLPPKSNICQYCSALNDVDLRAVADRVRRGPATDRRCPRCGDTMCTMDLQLGEAFYVERCDKCMGVFFDDGELETLLDKSVAKVFEVDHQRLAVLIEEEAPERPSTVRYVKCPICRRLMNRKNYGSRSAVVVDTCRDHGVWLDGGELSQLLKWAKAGGQLHADRKQREWDDEQQARERRRRIEAAQLDRAYGGDGWDGYTDSPFSDTALFVGLLGTVVRLLR